MASDDRVREDLAGMVLFCRGEWRGLVLRSAGLFALGKADAFDLLRDEAVGVRNSDLAKIPRRRKLEGDLASESGCLEEYYSGRGLWKSVVRLSKEFERYYLRSAGCAANIEHARIGG